MNHDETEDLFRKMRDRKAIETHNRQQAQQMSALTNMRDDIAIRVLIAMIEKSSNPIDFLATLPVNAYQFADAMLLARGGQ